ncbi:haloacid dehalogenase [Lactococcus hodotermopsidis]|uniref:Haloacid dehalogenase n=1 Tax=Pseudolactococcus hodotermopsidis TaxID=2709157 RepID=A0A6A0BEH9_9LACT|nr:YqeG family HAD IIIA-type phosphatase [Lactococcus hodotermopsidis]GFH42904.1 haloacid dehalogenase [Lactococcus hodotermopsidis]
MSIENYKPDFLLNAAYQLNAESLRRHDIRAVFVDLDNTLTAWNNPDGTPEMRAWLAEMKATNIKVIVVSNNKLSRVERAVKRFDVAFVSRAMKPFDIGIKKALKLVDEKPEHVVMVGDQLMTDIRASKRAGVRSVLVRPLVESDAWNTKLNRARERRVWRKLIEKYGEPEWQNMI